MPFSSGSFSVVYNWTTESGAPPIEIAKLDTQHADFATGLSNCILRDGTGLPTSATPWNGQNITGVAELQAARFVPTASTVPSNGMYLSAANTVAFASNTTLRASVNSTGNWTFAAPSSGASIASQGPITVTISGITQTIGNDGTGPFLDIAGANSWRLFTNSTQRLTVGSAGNVAIAAPGSGTALTVAGIAGNYAATFSDGTRTVGIIAGASVGAIGTTTNHDFLLQSNTSTRVTIAAAGNVTIAAPSSGVTLAATAPAAGTGIRIGDGTVNVDGTFAATRFNFGTTGSHDVSLITGGADRIRIGSVGNVTINAASSGDELTVIGSVVATSFAGDLTGNVTGNVSGSSGSTTGNAATATALQTARTINGTSFNGTANITVTAAADTLTGTTLAALSGVNLTALNATQLTSGTVPTARITSVETTATIDSVLIGFRSIPQNSQSANYTLVLTDSGRQILHPSGGGAGDTFTIPANSSVAYPVGTVLTFVNLDSNAVSIAITTDTLTIAGTSTTGTRTLGQNGYATAVKVTTTSWLITGVGLS